MNGVLNPEIPLYQQIRLAPYHYQAEFNEKGGFMKKVFKFTFFVLLGISALGFLATAFLYIFNPDKTEVPQNPEQVASVTDTANEGSAPIETSDQETEQPAPTETITVAEPEAPSDGAEGA